jgi:predicted Fe-S protein YdhL (DUF1289 family)
MIKEDPMAECFRCGRFLGEEEEWKKMDTEKGPICFVCHNEISAKERMEGDT